MPHAAIFALVDSGRTRLFVDHDGGLSLPSFAMRGPNAAMRHLEELVECEQWFSEDECEGGLLIDRDRQMVWIFGGDEIAYQQALQRALVRMLKGVWSGWQVRWAHRGVTDLAAQCGVSAPRTRSRRLPARFTAYDLCGLESPGQTESEKCWVSVRTSRGAIVDAIFDSRDRGVLGLSPELLPAILSARHVGPPAEPTVNCGAVVDIGFRTVVIWDSAPAANLAVRLARRWPTWSVQRQYRGWRRQMRETGRSHAVVSQLAADPAQVDRQLRSLFASENIFSAPIGGLQIARVLSRLSVAAIA
jgi:hypothetical protein